MENWLLSDKEKSIDSEWLIQNVETFFETVGYLYKSKDEKIISKVSSKLTNLFKDKEQRHQNLIINCVPILLKYYFIYYYEEKICSIIEVCLLTIYNLSLSEENVKLNKIRIPNLSTPSVYHSPQVTSTQFELTESAMSKYESEYVICEDQFKPYLDTINSEKRFNIIKFILLLYFSKLPTVIKSSKIYFCDLCLKLCKFNRQNAVNQPIYLNSEILIEMLHALFYLFNNDLELDAYIAIEAISDKAEDALMPDVMLISNAIKNLIQQSKMEPSAQKESCAKEKSFDSNASPSGSNQGFKVNETSSPPGSPKSSIYLLNPVEARKSLNDVYVSPSGEIRSAAKRASIKLQQQQQQFYLPNNNSKDPATPPPIPDYPPPLSNDSRENSINQIRKNENEYIPIIDETSEEIGDDEDTISQYSLHERL